MKRFLNPASYGAALLCFLLPFMNIRCNNMKIAEATGLEMAIGTKLTPKTDNPYLKNNSSESSDSGESTQTKSKDVHSIPLLITMLVLLGAGLAVLGMTLKKSDEKQIRKIAIASYGLVLVLLIAEVVMLNYAMRDMNNESMAGLLSWHLDIGFWFLTIISVGLIIYNIVWLKKLNMPPPEDMFNDFVPPPPPGMDI